MECLVSNLKTKVHRTTFQGRKYLVARATIIVPGVLNGSRGPAYYPLEEVQKNSESWNGIPIVVYHPEQNGKPVSANSPSVLEKQQVGFISSTHVNGKLSTKLYFDEEKTRKVDERVLDSLYKNKRMELSTGLYAKFTPAPENSSYRGRKYIYVARNYVPDHLAILPDQVGACSLDDGCGLNVNSQGRFELELVVNSMSNKESIMDPLNDEQRTILINDLIKNCDCWDEEDRDVLNDFPDEKLQKLATNVVRTHTSESKNMSTETIDLNSVPMGDLAEEMKRRKEMAGNKDEDKEVANKQLTAEEWLEQAPDEVKTTFRYAHQIEQEQKNALVEKLTANIKDGAEKKIQSERLRKRSIDDLKADVELMPVPEPVAPTGNADRRTDDGDNAWLSSALSKLGREPEDEALPLPTINWAEKDDNGEPSLSTVGMTQSGYQDPDSWLRSAPSSVREVVQNAFKSEQIQKDEIVTKLVSNIEDSNKRFRMRDKLEAKPLAELREMLDLMPKQASEPAKRSNYTGAAAPATNRLADNEKEDILPLPSMSFDK